VSQYNGIEIASNRDSGRCAGGATSNCGCKSLVYAAVQIVKQEAHVVVGIPVQASGINGRRVMIARRPEGDKKRKL